MRNIIASSTEFSFIRDDGTLVILAAEELRELAKLYESASRGELDPGFSLAPDLR